MLAEIDELRGLKRGVLRLGLPPVGSGILFAPLFARFRKAYPGIDIRLVEQGSARLEEILRLGEIDFAASLLPVDDDFEAREVRRDQLMTLVAADNPLSALGYNPANNFLPQPPQSLGGNIGNMTLTGGVDAAFDGTVNKRREMCAALSVSNSSYKNTVGKNWNADPSGTSLTLVSTAPVETHVVSSFTITAPNDAPFLNAPTPATGFYLNGSNNGATWTRLYSGTTAGTVGESITANTTSGAFFQYHQIALQGDGTSQVAIAQAVFNVSDAAPNDI